MPMGITQSMKVISVDLNSDLRFATLPLMTPDETITRYTVHCTLYISYDTVVLVL